KGESHAEMSYPSFSLTKYWMLEIDSPREMEYHYVENEEAFSFHPAGPFDDCRLFRPHPGSGKGRGSDGC
ncbi:MAG: hypothetical protein ACI4UT_00835, partial [Candidatus Enteromonas sp.]